MARKRKQSENESCRGGSDESSVRRRPNSCDTCMLSVVMFLGIVSLVAAIPLILMAKGTLEVDYVSKKLREMGPR